MKDGDLNAVCKGDLSTSQALEYFEKILLSYAELYKQKLMHRDLKPENILLSDN